MSSKLKAPWYKYYKGVKEHLEYPDISVYELIKRRAESNPNYISYNYYGNQKTYKEFIEQIDECARAFKQYGIKKKDVISICMPNTPEAIIAFYAINKIGAIANMIHPLSSKDEIKFYVNGTKSKYIIAIDLSVNKINEIMPDTSLKRIIVVSVGDSMPLHMKLLFQMTKGRKIKVEKKEWMIPWKKFIEEGKGYDKKIESHYTGEEIAAILYSGGTTGIPKGIELTNLNLNALAMQAIESCACIEAQDKILSIMPIFHGFGLGICIHAAQYIGAVCIILPTFSADTFDQLLKKYKPNVIAGVPTLYEALLKNKKLDGYDLSFLKCVISGGDSLSISLKKKIDRFLHHHGANIQVREGYGLTECVTGSCCTPINDYRKGSIGIPYPDMYYKIVKLNSTEEAPYGEEGEIVIHGPTVMKGYLNNKKETEMTLKKHSDGLIWLHTGDLGSMDEDGFVYFKQRLKRVIVSSGYNIYPQYIENVIDSHPDVLMSCVIGIPHPYKVQVAKAFIVLKPGVEKSDKLLNSIRKNCEEKIAKYSWPYEYEFRDELPKTLVGKIAYNELIKEESEKHAKK